MLKVGGWTWEVRDAHLRVLSHNGETGDLEREHRHPAELKLRGYWCESAAGSVIREFGNDPEEGRCASQSGVDEIRTLLPNAGWRTFAPAWNPPFTAAGGWCGR